MVFYTAGFGGYVRWGSGWGWESEQEEVFPGVVENLYDVQKQNRSPS